MVKYKTWTSETLHIILNMPKHYNKILKIKLRLLEESGEKTFGVTHVYHVIQSLLLIRERIKYRYRL